MTSCNFPTLFTLQEYTAANALVLLKMKPYIFDMSVQYMEQGRIENLRWALGLLNKEQLDLLMERALEYENYGPLMTFRTAFGGPLNPFIIYKKKNYPLNPVVCAAISLDMSLHLMPPSPRKSMEILKEYARASKQANRDDVFNVIVNIVQESKAFRPVKSTKFISAM